MKVFCLILLVAGCLGQVPIIPPGGEGGQAMTDGMGGTPSPIGVPDPANWNRPCRRSDLHCVRNFFKDHSHCKMAHGKVKEPVTRFLSNWFFPAYNITTTSINALFTGFNTAKVGDFYIDRATDKAVLTIEFENLVISNKDFFISFLRRAREPIITYGYQTVDFPSLTITVTIPEVDNLRLDMADIFGFANTAPVVNLDPKLGESSDPVVPLTLAALLSDEQAVTAGILTQAPYVAAVYIQNIICDFGLKLV